MRQKELIDMYGQKAQFGVLSAGITAASWWMWSITIALTIAAAVLCYRAAVTLLSNDVRRRP